MKVSVRAAAAVLGAIGLLATVSACGDDTEPGPGRDAVVALGQIQAEFDAGTVAAVCAAMAVPAVLSAITFGRARRMEPGR